MAKKIIISLKEITKDYTSGDIITHVLNSVSLDIYQGDFIAITGPREIKHKNTARGSGNQTLGKFFGLENGTSAAKNEQSKTRGHDKPLPPPLQSPAHPLFLQKTLFFKAIFAQRSILGAFPPKASFFRLRVGHPAFPQPAGMSWWRGGSGPDPADHGAGLGAEKSDAARKDARRHPFLMPF